MRYAYEDLSPEQFEKLVVLLGQELLGLAVQGFATGPDGGRDARFEGTAQLHPSTASPWAGKVILQAKHTNGLNRSFSEGEFYSSTSNSGVLNEELPRIKALVDSGDLNHYMLFSNRRLTAGGEAGLRAVIETNCGLPSGSVYLCGLEQLELWLRRFPKVASMADLDPFDSPLIVSSADLAEIVEELARQHDVIVDAIDDAPVERVSFAEKNRINAMTAEYAKELRKVLFRDENQIRAFLAAPENLAMMELYEVTVADFQAKIIAKRQNYQNVDDVINYLIDLLFARDAVLRQRTHKRLTRSLVYYMYWNCDIGKVEDDAAADEALTP